MFKYRTVRASDESLKVNVFVEVEFEKGHFVADERNKVMDALASRIMTVLAEDVPFLKVPLSKIKAH